MKSLSDLVNAQYTATALPKVFSRDLQVHQSIRTHKWTYVWPTLVGVHIATEVFETVHPGVTGLCFIIMVYGTPKFQQYVLLSY